jgi:hypothetical protein
VIQYRNKSPAEERHAQHKKKIDAKTQKTTGEIFESQSRIAHEHQHIIKVLRDPLLRISA